jgi:predicted pyridoxine 5'-phosphate oxidase superfamily flavin-nucleotide-binding protein
MFADSERRAGSERRPWHEGEIAARRRAGAPQIGPVIRRFMTAQLQAFLATLPLVFIAGRDELGRPAASMFRGAPGFISCPEPGRMEIAAALPAGDPLRMSLRPGAPFGLIGLDFSARRRNRVNGRVVAVQEAKLALAVDEAFGNCPKYIFPRKIFSPCDVSAAWTPGEIDESARNLIAGADVFFIATRGPEGVDISHRGGLPGFVRMTRDGDLEIADYSGNNYFNTFGNLLHDSAAALLFMDFAHGSALHLSGQVRIGFCGEGRSLTFAPASARWLRAAEPFGSGAIAPAPEAPAPIK